MECGPCTLCCKLLDVKETKSKSGEWCQFCDPKNGCGIYETRPEECSGFECMYRQAPRCSEDVRPDKIRTVFEKVSDRIIFGTYDQHLKKASSVLERQIVDFKSQGYSVILRKAGTNSKVIIRNKDHAEEDIINEFEEFVKARTDGSTIVYN